MAKKQAAEAEAEDVGVDFSDGDSLAIDWGNIEEASFEAMPRATYPVVIDDVEFNYSQSAGNPMWSLTLEVSEGEFAGRKLYSHLVFAGQGLAFTKRQIARLAPDLLEVTPFDPQDEALMDSLRGRNARAKVTIRKFEGEDRNNVRDLLAADDAGSFV